MTPPIFVHPDPQGVFPHAAVTYAVVGLLLVVAVAFFVWVWRVRARHSRGGRDTSEH